MIFTNLIFDFIGGISNIFKCIPKKCHTGNKKEILNIKNCIINTNQEIITSNVKVKSRKYIIYEISNCRLYQHILDSYDGLTTYYTSKILLDLTNIYIYIKLFNGNKT